MSELTAKLELMAINYDGSQLGELLKWSKLHIESQDEALAELRAELEAESNERIKMENAIHAARGMLGDLSAMLDYSRPVNIELARDHAPHINRMAAAGVEPYAKKPRKQKGTK